MGRLNPTLQGGRGLAGAALCLVMLLSACGPLGGYDQGEVVGGSPEEARQMIEDWFVQARTGVADGGWSLLYPSVRDELIGSSDVYQAALRTADWEGFTYSIGDVRVADGEYRVLLHIIGGEDQVPAFMRDWGLIQFPPLDGKPSDNGVMTVRISPTGPDRGIQAVGG